MRLTDTLAERVASRMRRDGYRYCHSEMVWEVYRTGELADVRHIEMESLASRILQEFEELGLEVPQKESTSGPRWDTWPEHD